MENIIVDLDNRYYYKLMIRLRDGFRFICWGVIFKYDGKKYVHIRDNERRAFNWLDIFNYEHEKVAVERGFEYYPCKNKTEIKIRFGFSLDDQFFNYFGKWKCKWVADNCLEVAHYNVIYEDHLINNIGL